MRRERKVENYEKKRIMKRIDIRSVLLIRNIRMNELTNK